MMGVDEPYAPTPRTCECGHPDFEHGGPDADDWGFGECGECGCPDFRLLEVIPDWGWDGAL